MALPASTLATYQAIGNREDLSDMIYRIDPTDTPFMSGAAKEKATAVLHEWQTQALAAAASNAQLEGDVIALNARTVTTRLGNIHQISRKAFGVSRTEQMVNPAGRDNELSFQKMLKGQALKIDIDSILCGTNQAKNAGNATTARVTASVLSWIKTNSDKGASGVDPAAADGTGTRTDGTQRAFTEQLLKNVLRLQFNQGGKPNLILAGPFNKQVFSTFTGRSTPMEQSSSRTIVAAVDVYKSDFGTLKVAPSRNMRARDVLILETGKWAVGNLPGSAMVSFQIGRAHV